MKKVTITYDTPLDALLAISRRLGQYENMYRMESEEFYFRYRMGKLPDDIDYIEWSGDYQHYLELRREVEKKFKDARKETV